MRFTLLTEPKTATDKFLESFGARGWMKRKLKKSMRRLRDILEGEDRGRGERPSIAGGRAQAGHRLAASQAGIGSAALVSTAPRHARCSSPSPPSPSAACGNKEERHPRTATPRASTSTSAA